MLMLGIGILVGQAIFVTYNWNNYQMNRHITCNTSQEAPERLRNDLNSKDELRGYEGDAPLIEVEIDEDWVNHKATF